MPGLPGAREHLVGAPGERRNAHTSACSRPPDTDDEDALAQAARGSTTVWCAVGADRRRS